MAYWLLKTERSVYSYGDLERDKKTVWDGVANNTALKNLRAMNKGDRVFIYHSGDEKCIVGIAEIVSGAYPDPQKTDSRFVVVDLKPRKRLKNTVPLADIKARKGFRDFALVRIPRLSVMPVSAGQWKTLLSMSD